MNKNELYIKHILEAIQAIESYTKDVDAKQFYKDKLLQDGVIRQLEIIGEASSNLSEDFRQQHSNIPWEDITGMRNMLIHEYYRVDLAEVWSTVNQDLPELNQALK